MANAHSFPLLRLPDLAREHVVLVMDIRDQYLFATLSKKSKKVAKNGVRFLSYRFEMMLGSHESSILIRKEGTNQSFELLVSRFNNPAVAGNPNRLCLKLESIKKNSTELLPFLSDLFKISRFNLEADCISKKFLEDIWASIKILEIKIYKLEVRPSRIMGEANEIFVWTMKNCRDVKRLTNNCGTTQTFKWDSQQPFSFEFLTFYNAPWLTMSHITRLFLVCKFFKITTDEHQLTTDDLKEIIKLWINDSNLEYFEVVMNQDINLNHILSDIVKQPVQRARIENRLQFFDPDNAFKIRQKSGKEAVVCVRRDRYFKITTHFNTSKCDFWDAEEDEDDDTEDEEELENEDEDDEDEHLGDEDPVDENLEEEEEDN